MISAITFDKKLKEEVSLELYDEKMRMINNIKRLPNSDTILVSGFRVISVVEFKMKAFVELKQLRNIHMGNIYSFCLRGEMFFLFVLMIILFINFNLFNIL